MAQVISFLADGSRVVTEYPDPNPDETPDEDVLILRRVIVNIMRDNLGLTNAQVRAAFRAAKRQVD